jgi:hypothetical protein
MADDTARALGAASGAEITIKGKAYKIRPLSARELSELERIAVRRFKRRYLETFAENLDLMPEGTGDAFMRSRMEECAKWDVNDLPEKYVYDCSRVPITNKVKKWIRDEMLVPDSSELTDTSIRSLVSNSLDNESLTQDKCKELTGVRPRKLRTGYVNWWVTAEVDGMVEMILLCIDDKDITKDDLFDAFAENQSGIIDAAREIETVSVPAAGNG